MIAYVRTCIRPSWFKLNTSPASCGRGHSDCNPCPSTMDATSEPETTKQDEEGAKRKGAPTTMTEGAIQNKLFCGAQAIRDRARLPPAKQPTSEKAHIPVTPDSAGTIPQEGLPPATPMPTDTHLVDVQGLGVLPQTGPPPAMPSGHFDGGLQNDPMAQEPLRNLGKHFAVSPTEACGLTILSPTEWDGACTIVLNCADVVTRGSKAVEVSVDPETGSKIIQVPSGSQDANRRRLVLEPGRSPVGKATSMYSVVHEIKPMHA